jgi:hypothetical protein
MDRRRWAAAYLAFALGQAVVVLSLPGQVRPALPALLWIGGVFLLLRARRRWLRVLGAAAEVWTLFEIPVATLSWNLQLGLLATLQAGCVTAAVGAAWSAGPQRSRRRRVRQSHSRLSSRLRACSRSAPHVVAP